MRILRSQDILRPFSPHANGVCPVQAVYRPHVSRRCRSASELGSRGPQRAAARQSHRFSPQRAGALGVPSEPRRVNRAASVIEEDGMKMKGLLGVLASALCLANLAAQPQLPPAAARSVDYQADVKPLLAQNCYGCHGPEVQQSGLRLDLRQNALRGGDYGPVIVPGKSADSKLIRRLIGSDGGLQMPPTGQLP